RSASRRRRGSSTRRRSARAGSREGSPPASQRAVSGAEPLLSARGVTKRYRRLTVLKAVDLDLAEGEAVALLGPNGAGKTTLLSILAGVSPPNGGTVVWRGPARARVGWVPQRPALYQRLTVRENLRLFAALEGADDPAALA